MTNENCITIFVSVKILAKTSYMVNAKITQIRQSISFALVKKVKIGFVSKVERLQKTGQLVLKKTVFLRERVPEYGFDQQRLI